MFQSLHCNVIYSTESRSHAKVSMEQYESRQPPEALWGRPFPQQATWPPTEASEKAAPPPRAARFGAQLAAKTAEQAHGGLGATSRTRGDQPQPRLSRAVCVREHYPAASEFISFSFFCSWEPSQPVPMEPKSKLQIQELCCPTPPAKA